MSGDQQVQSQKGDALFGFYEFNDVPRTFKSGADYVAYKKGLLANKKRANVIAAGDVQPTMDLANAQNITSRYSENDDASLEQRVYGMDFYFFGTNYGNADNGGIWWSTNNALTFSEGTDAFSLSGESNISGVKGIFIGFADREMEEIYVVPVQQKDNYDIYKIIVFEHTLDASGDKARFELRLVRERMGYFRQWIEVRTRTPNSLMGFFNIQAPGDKLQYTFGTQYEWNRISSFVLASGPKGDNWKLFDHCHLTI